jgi:PadR family transcriptional regulator, regulatory protein PadR
VNNDTQIVKGILEGCLLKIIADEEIYGYGAVEQLNRLGFEVNEATVYPILLRLQSKGFLNTDKRPSPIGPARKYYSLTAQGKAYLAEFKKTWASINKTVNHIMEDEENDKAR